MQKSPEVYRHRMLQGLHFVEAALDSNPTPGCHQLTIEESAKLARAALGLSMTLHGSAEVSSFAGATDGEGQVDTHQVLKEVIEGIFRFDDHLEGKIEADVRPEHWVLERALLIFQS